MTTVTVTPVNEFTSEVKLGCSGLPPGLTCSFGSSSVTPNGNPVTSGLTITDGDTNRRSADTIGLRSRFNLCFPASPAGVSIRHYRATESWETMLSVRNFLHSLLAGMVLSGCGDHKSDTPETYLVTVSGSSSGGVAVNQTSALTITITN